MDKFVKRHMLFGGLPTTVPLQSFDLLASRLCGYIRLDRIGEVSCAGSGPHGR
jgi:hypothetical protein